MGESPSGSVKTSDWALAVATGLLGVVLGYIERVAVLRARRRGRVPPRGLFLAIPPRDQAWAGWIAFVPVLVAHRKNTWKHGFWLGWLAGTLGNLGAFYWVYELMVTYSAIPAVGAAALTLLQAVQQGLREAFWLATSRSLSQRYQNITPLLYAVVYVACEFLWPTIFPLHLSNSQHCWVWTHQVMDLAGPAGLSFVMVLTNVWLWQALSWKKPHYLALASLPLLASVGYGVVRVAQVEKTMAEASPLTVAMVEHDVGIVSSSQQVVEGLARLQNLSTQASREHPLDLVVFPETAIKTPPPPVRVEGSPEWQQLQRYPLKATQMAQNTPFSPQAGFTTPLIFGTVAEDPDRPGPIPGRARLHNIAFLVDENGQVQGKALKNKLLLFGEFIPGAAYFPWIYTRVLTRASSLVPGQEPGLLPFRAHTIGVSICYEDILPTFHYQLAQGSPNLLVNLTNDAWFGDTAEPAAHLALAKARAVEQRLYLVRSTTTGISAFVDPLGQVLKQTAGNGPQYLVEKVAWMPGRTTLFCYVGPYFAWLCVVFTGVGLVAAGRGASD